MSSEIEVTTVGKVATCRINSPETRNAITPALADALIDALEQLDADAGARCIVLTGTEECFATGHAIRTFSSAAAELPVDVLMPTFWSRFSELGTPIVAAPQGWALAFGFELALASDLLVVERTTSFGSPEITFGLIPFGGATQRLARAVGRQRTMELVLTGRRMGGKQAFAWGIANILAEKRRCVEQAQILAEEVAERPPAALRLAKRAVAAADELALTEGLERERALFAEALATDDRVEAVDALLGKRHPDFEGR